MTVEIDRDTLFVQPGLQKGPNLKFLKYVLRSCLMSCEGCRKLTQACLRKWVPFALARFKLPQFMTEILRIRSTSTPQNGEQSLNYREKP